jgi:phytoene dehydrogenase-like protein
VGVAEPACDALVVGSGPNGLAAAVTLAREGLAVRVIEARATPGGGCRSGPLSLPGFVHDHCSTVHPLGAGSPFLRALPLERHGLRWIQPDAPLAHALRPGHAVLLERSLAATAARLGVDGPSYTRLLGPFVDRFHDLAPMVLGPLRVPTDPVLLARFGWRGLQSMRGIGQHLLATEPARALLAGIAAHAMLPLTAPATSAFALVLAAAAHAVGWPLAAGGSRAIASALVAHLLELGGRVECGREVTCLDSLPRARAYLLDLTPRQVLRVASDRLSASYRRRLGRYRYGPGVFKLDWALDAPIPWSDPSCARAATVHLAGAEDEVTAAEAAVHAGRVPERPFVLLVQASLFDASRAPAGRHTAWGYCHVPNGWVGDASEAVEQQIERHAPGFRDVVAARTTRTAAEMESYNPNYVGGDINGGIADLRQLFFRPMLRLDPYTTSAPDVFLCSSSTPPGGGVHGMCGYWAARSVLRRVFGRKPARLVPSPDAGLRAAPAGDS